MLKISSSRIDAATIGPGIGPAVGPSSISSLPPPPPSLPAPPRQAAAASGAQPVPDAAYNAATVSAGPQPATIFAGAPVAAAPVMLPPLHYQGHDASQPFGYQPPPAPVAVPPGMHPSRLANLAAGPPGVPQVGMVRSADQMEGVEGSDIPPAKRQKVARLPGGQYYPEQDWINLHPVSTVLMDRNLCDR